MYNERMDIARLHNFEYKFDAGPLSEAELRAGDFKQGNCRLALQDYFYQINNRYISAEDILLPRGFRQTGKQVKNFGDRDISFTELETGDVIYAEKIRDKNNNPVDKSRGTFPSEDDWLISLHSAIFFGRMDDKKPEEFIWHSSAISGGTALWPVDKFFHYYKPIVAKRIE